MIYSLGFLFSTILGTMGFYLYRFTNKDTIIGFLFPKDNSLYQYIKCGYTPMLMWMIVEFFRLDATHNIFVIKGLSFLIFTLIVIISYLVFNKLFKFKGQTITMISFYVGILAAYITTFLLNNAIYLSIIIKLIGICSFILVLASYLLNNIKIKKSEATPASRD